MKLAISDKRRRYAAITGKDDWQTIQRTLYAMWEEATTVKLFSVNVEKETFKKRRNKRKIDFERDGTEVEKNSKLLEIIVRRVVSKKSNAKMKLHRKWRSFGWT